MEEAITEVGITEEVIMAISQVIMEEVIIDCKTWNSQINPTVDTIIILPRYFEIYLRDYNCNQLYKK